MAFEAAQKGGEIRWSTKSEQLLRDGDGPVTGAVVSLEDGSYAQINAKSVVIAAGDYSGNDDMLNYYAPMTAYAMDARWYMPPGCNTGDLLSQAIWAGGAMQKSEPHACVMHLDFGTGDYPTYVPGIGHGRCVTFGRIAGINAAGDGASTEIPDLDI